jgi:RNA recognition motif-containing protein
MATKLYVGNLDYQVTADQLKDLFSQAGNVVEANLITDRFSGRSKGFAFVEMEDEKSAKEAIKLLHDKDFQNRKLVVNEARPKRDSNYSSGPRNRR